MLWQFPFLHCLQNAEIPPWQTKGIYTVLAGAFLGDRTAQFTISYSSWRAHMLRADFQNNTELPLVVPTSFMEVLNKSFWKPQPESTAIRSPVMVHQPFICKPLSSWKPFQESTLYRIITFFGNCTCMWRDRVCSHLEEGVQSTHSKQ